MYVDKEIDSMEVYARFPMAGKMGKEGRKKKGKKKGKRTSKNT